MFKIGATIIYGINGVCTVEAIEKQSFDKSGTLYYVLRPVFTNCSTTIFVPTDKENLTSQMQPLLKKNEIVKILRSVPEESDEWITDNRARADKFKATLDSGDRAKIIKLARDLHLHRQRQESVGKRLHLGDEAILHKAEKIIGEEIAFSVGIDLRDVEAFIVKYISK